MLERRMQTGGTACRVQGVIALRWQAGTCAPGGADGQRVRRGSQERATEACTCSTTQACALQHWVGAGSSGGLS